MRDTILIIGGGELGQAIARIFVAEHLQIAMWDVDPTKCLDQTPLLELVASASHIFYCAPTSSLRKSIESWKHVLPASCTVTILSKGLEVDSGKTVDQIAQETLGESARFCLLGGPLLAEELQKGALALVATASKEAGSSCLALLSNTPISAKVTTDLRGTAISGVLKNIYSVLFGMLSIHYASHNHTGALTAHCTEELRKLCVLYGGNEETALGLAGLGDFIATSTSMGSANTTAGREFALTGTITVACEGYSSLPAVQAFLGPKITDFPLLNALVSILKQSTPIPEAIALAMSQR